MKMNLLKKMQQFRKEVSAVMVNFFAMQVEEGWITIDQVPKKWREKVRRLVELANDSAEVAE